MKIEKPESITNPGTGLGLSIASRLRNLQLQLCLEPGGQVWGPGAPSTDAASDFDWD